MTKRWSGEKREGDRQLWMKKETGEPDILVVKKGIVGILKESCKKEQDDKHLFKEKFELLSTAAQSLPL